ncbi:MAG: SO_0444 family Cu/Zn efflux transporter [Candidatus Wallbacteria bacterium]|nr:SO_0444 family Cu/Zn efflux transporter [Candidatus Wallbacteria bacterium]
MITNFFFEAVNLWNSLAPYVLVGMAIAGIVHLFLDDQTIIRHLGQNSFTNVVKAAAFGVPLPVCSCGVIPLAAALRKSGAGISATLSFLVSTPTSGIDSILATYSMLGPVFAIFRPVIALLSGIAVGAVSNLFPENEPLPGVDQEETCHSCSSHEETSPPQEGNCCTHEMKNSKKLSSVLRYAFLDLPADMGRWLIIGVLVGALITIAFPFNAGTLFSRYPYLDFLLILFFALPLYVCATASIPIAYALMLNGFSPGAAMVFLIAGPATNSITLTFIYQKLGRRAFTIFLATIAIISFFSGAVFNMIWTGTGSMLPDMHTHTSALGDAAAKFSGLLLLVLVLLPEVVKLFRSMRHDR